MCHQHVGAALAQPATPPESTMQRRDFIALAAAGGGAVFASGLAGCASLRRRRGSTDFYFVQLSDTHWGFKGPAQPGRRGTLQKAVAAVNALRSQPDFIVFTGDLTHTTDDPAERRRRLAEFKAIVAELKVKNVRFMPGEHDASLDRGEAFKEFFGATHYSFDHKGVHFVALDNVSDPARADRRGAARLAARPTSRSRTRTRRSSCSTHRPLFDLVPQVGLGDQRRRAGDRAADAPPRTSPSSTATSTRSTTR